MCVVARPGAPLRKRRPIIRESVQQSDHAEALLRMIFGLSTNFISLPPDDVDDGINDVLKAIGTFARVDRSGVFQFSENGDKVGRTHEWSANGVANRLEYVSAESLSWLCGRIRSCEVVHIPDVWKLQAEAAQEKNEFLRIGLRSIVAVPIVSGYSVMGFIEFESLHEEKVWSENIISLLKIVGEIFAFALSRKRITEALKQSESKYKVLFEHANDAIFLVEGGGLLSATRRDRACLPVPGSRSSGGLRLNSHLQHNRTEGIRKKHSSEGVASLFRARPNSSNGNTVDTGGPFLTRR